MYTQVYFIIIYLLCIFDTDTVDVIVGSVFGVVILITIVVVAVVIVCVCWRAVRRGSSSVVYHRVTSTPYPVASDDTPAAGYPV